MSNNKTVSGTKKDGKPALVPKLRFPEFRGQEGWKEKRLADVLSPIVRERAKPSEPYKGLGLRSHGKGTFLKPQEDPAKNSMDQLFEVKCADLIVNITFAWEGAVAIAQASDDGSLVSHRFPTYTFTKGEATPEFFQYIIVQKQFVYNLGVISPGGAGRNRVLSKNDFLKLAVALPSLAEQQKIAECLNSLDEVIAAQTQKVDALKTQKKGLMQQLFPRPERIENGVNVPAETQPYLRFPKFRGTAEWEPTTIGALGRFYYGKSAPKWSLAEDAPTPCVRYGELYTKFGPIITETHSRTNTDPDTLRFSKGGEILIPRVGEKPEDFGKCCAYLPLKGIAIGEMISVFETRQHPLFYTYYFRNMYRSFATVVEGQNVKNLYYTELEPLPIRRPSIPEQQKIAECLSSVDKVITAEIHKLEALKRHKRGLMHQLFPTPPEAEP